MTNDPADATTPDEGARVDQPGRPRASAPAPDPTAGGDVAEVAARTLDALAAVVRSDRSAVLLDDDGWAVPVALRGAERVPWDDPHQPHSALHRTWTDVVAAAGCFEEIGSLDADNPLAIAASSTASPSSRWREVLTVPLRSAEQGLLGVLAADRDGAAYEPDEERAAGLVARGAEPALRLAVLVSRHREEAALAERSRLERRLHDGLAQELAALGYQADATRAVVRRGGPMGESAVDALHAAVRAVVGEVRVYLSELVPSPRGLDSLAELLEEEVEAAASATGADTRVDLRERRLRFEQEHERAIREVVAAVLADARGAGDVRMIEVAGVLDAPYAAFTLAHDGTTRLASGTFRGSALVHLGGDVRVNAVGQSHPVVTVRLSGTIPRVGSMMRGDGP